MKKKKRRRRKKRKIERIRKVRSEKAAQRRKSGSRKASNKEPGIKRESRNAREGIYPYFRFFYGRLPGDTVGPSTPCFPLNPETVVGSVKNRGFIHAYSCWLESGESE